MGIDRIVAEADVAKTTLYKHFCSKEDLVNVCLIRRDGAIRAWIDSYLSIQGNSPAAQILAIFDFLDQWFQMEDFHGCAFTNTSLELHGSISVVHETAALHKTAILALFRCLTEEAGVADAAALSEQLLLLYEGAIVSALVRPAPLAARYAKAAASVLLEAAKL